jgi:hypothetical protein
MATRGLSVASRLPILKLSSALAAESNSATFIKAASSKKFRWAWEAVLGF